MGVFVVSFRTDIKKDAWVAQWLSICLQSLCPGREKERDVSCVTSSAHQVTSPTALGAHPYDLT